MLALQIPIRVYRRCRHHRIVPVSYTYHLNRVEVVNYLKDVGLKDNYKVIIGGAEITKEKAETMGCDGQADNAVDALALCDRLIDS